MKGPDQQHGPAAAPKGRLAVLMPGLGAVATTFMAGVELLRRGQARPIGSLTQLGALGGPGDSRVPVSELTPLAPVSELVFGSWDIHGESAYEVAVRSGVLEPKDLERARPFLSAHRPRAGVHDPERVRNLTPVDALPRGPHRKTVERLREDIRAFKRELEASRAVMVFCASTEVYRPPGDVLGSLAAFERGLDTDDQDISPTLLYAYAALMEDVPFINGTPNVSVDTPAIQELALARGLPIAGKDFKSGQTLLKTVLAPALKARLLGLHGWFSTNILGNRDGEVLDDPAAFRSKEMTKTGVLDTLLSAEEHPDLYGDVHHKVTIHYYPPRGDAKEGWDNIDLFGWLGYPMQIKVNFLCRDSILAAPLVLDLALFADLAARHGRGGLQEWLSFYFKSPTVPPGQRPEHDLFLQRARLEETLRAMAAGVRPALRQAKVGKVTAG